MDEYFNGLLREVKSNEPNFILLMIEPAYERSENKAEFRRLFQMWVEHKNERYPNDAYSDHFEVFSDTSARLDLYGKNETIYIEGSKIYIAVDE